MRETIPTAAEIDAITPRQHATYENSLRRAAQRQGLLLRKSRRRDPRALDYGLYVLVEDERGNSLPGAQTPVSTFANGVGMSLDEIHTTLLKGRRVQR